MKKVLIVEDDLISGKMLKEMVEYLGHCVIGIAPNAEKALIYVKNKSPDLVFMDISLSGEMNGLYLTELLTGYYNITVLFVSIHADPKTIAHAKKYGSGYIIKPFTINDIESLLMQLPDEKTEFQENKKNTDVIHIKDDNKILFISINDVIYIESQGHFLNIFTKDNEYVIRDSLKNILAKSKNNTFIQAHRSFVVNKNYIEELVNENYSYYIKMKHCNNLVPVSKKNLQNIKNAYMK
jgi:DNA-binding LytR/AlgR family response regulator